MSRELCEEEGVQRFRTENQPVEISPPVGFFPALGKVSPTQFSFPHFPRLFPQFLLPLVESR